MCALNDYKVISTIKDKPLMKKVQKLPMKTEYILKQVCGDGVSSKRKQKLMLQRLKGLQLLHHPHVLQYYDFGTDTDENLYVVMEYCPGGNLKELVAKCMCTSSYLEEGFIWRVVYQVLCALSFCHNNTSKMVHGNINSSCVLFDREDNVKLGDFEGDHADFKVPYAGNGNEGSPSSSASDILALGVLVYRVLMMHIPGAGISLEQHIHQKGERRSRLMEIPVIYSHHLREVLEAMIFPTSAICHTSSDLLLLVEKKLQKDIWASFMPVKTGGVPPVLGKSLNCEDDGRNSESDSVNLHSVSKPRKASNAVLSTQGFKGALECACGGLSKDRWHARILSLKKAEANLRRREKVVLKKERQLCLRLNKACSLQPSSWDSLTKEQDSTLSADSGSDSIPTVTKLNPDKLENPFIKMRLSQRKRVHFQGCDHFFKSSTSYSLCKTPRNSMLKSVSNSGLSPSLLHSKNCSNSFVNCKKSLSELKNIVRNNVGNRVGKENKFVS